MKDDKEEIKYDQRPKKSMKPKSLQMINPQIDIDKKRRALQKTLSQSVVKMEQKLDL
jgi:hypothetical protein